MRLQALLTAIAMNLKKLAAVRIMCDPIAEILAARPTQASA